MLTVCPGDSISIACTHDSVAGLLTRWILPGVSICFVTHDRQSPPDCSPFTITMVSDGSGQTLNSTIQTTVTESLDGTVVECRAGGFSTSPQVGNITIRIYGNNTCLTLKLTNLLMTIYDYFPDPPSVPTIGPITYSIESALTGSVTFTASSMSSPVSYNASVIGGSVQVTGNTITVTGLSYTRTHTVTARAVVCPGIETNSTPFFVSFNTAGTCYIVMVNYSTQGRHGRFVVCKLEIYRHVFAVQKHSTLSRCYKCDGKFSDKIYCFVNSPSEFPVKTILSNIIWYSICEKQYVWILFSASTLSQPVAAVVCSNPSLPIRVSWNVKPGVSEIECRT